MEVALTGWYVGYVAASAVILVVVILVGWILSLARRIGVQAQGILAEVRDIKVNTSAVPAVGKVNDNLALIVDHAVAARKALVGQ